VKLYRIKRYAGVSKGIYRVGDCIIFACWAAIKKDSKLGLLRVESIIAVLHHSRFCRGGLPVPFTATHNVTVLVYGYQSIDMHFIVVSVKFYGGLSMSILRNKQLFFVDHNFIVSCRLGPAILTPTLILLLRSPI
jgi:hypothetical protein